DNYENVDKMDAHYASYKSLSSILDDEKMSQEVRNITQKLLKSKKTDVSKANNSFWNTSSPASSSSNNGKKRSATELISTSSIIPTINTEMTCFVPDEDVPLKANGSLDILEVIKKLGNNNLHGYGISNCIKFIGDLELANVESAATGLTDDLSERIRACVPHKFYEHLPAISWSEFNQRVMTGANLVIAEGLVLDIHKWILIHPDGQKILQRVIGTDITNDFFFNPSVVTVINQNLT
ncbi:16680_t:CDS:2, partial [Funneliformis caledonium]